MSDDLEHLDDYPAQGVVSAEAALVTAWSSLENFHSDLVLVGGLAIYLHTRDKVDPLYRPTATLDVDLGNHPRSGCRPGRASGMGTGGGGVQGEQQRPDLSANRARNALPGFPHGASAQYRWHPQCQRSRDLSLPWGQSSAEQSDHANRQRDRSPR